MYHKRITEEFVELAMIDSPSRGERQMADVLKQKLLELGCQVREDRAGEAIGGNAGNLIAVLPGTIGKPVILAAHMDRVPNGLGVKPVVTEDTITSDGTTILGADDLSGVVAILDGLRRLRESGQPHCTVEVVFTVCEEQLVAGSSNLDYSPLTAKHAYCFDSPGHTGRIINAAPYKIRLDLHVYGKTAHAGQAPEKGINALKLGAKVLADLAEGRLDHETTANWAMAQAGIVSNVVCDHACFGGEARSRDPEKLQRYADYVRQHAEAILGGTGTTWDLQVWTCFEGFCVPPEDELLTTLCAAMEQQGLTPLIEGGGGGMDANNFNARGIRSVGVATGYFKNHSTEEFLYIDDLNRAGRLIYDLILAFSQK